MSYFKCFSVPLKKFLMDKGFRYEFVAKDVVNDKTFWLFFTNQKFEEALKEWSNNRPIANRR